MEDIDRQPAPANPPPGPDAVLAEQLAQCHKAIENCFECADDTKFSFSAQIEALTVAERLIRVSVVLAKALDKSPKEFTHRIIVERPAPMIDVTPEAAWTPPPPGASRKQPRKENRMK